MNRSDYGLRNVYISTLPRHVDDFNGHPIFWSDEDLQRILGTYTVAYHSVRNLQQMIKHEYDIISSIISRRKEKYNTTAPNDGTDIPLSFEQYRIARVNVLSRSFGTGPIPLTSDLELKERIMNIHAYLPYLNFTNGHHVMVPILDQLNHRGQDYNVDFAYNIRNQSFVVHTNKLIPIGHDIIDHYGKHKSSHLFAKYGFINYDSSGYNEAAIALWYNLYFPYDDNTDEFITRLNKMQMLRYLQYDDGYESCIGDPQIVLITNATNHDSQLQQYITAAWRLKQMKYKILLSIFGLQSSRWNVQMSPQMRGHFVETSSDNLQQRRRQQRPGSIQSDHVQTLLSTCRLLVLRHDDYNDSAIDVLQNGILKNDRAFRLSSQYSSTIVDHRDQALEFRTYMCLARMIQTAMSRFPRSTVSKQLEYMEHLEITMSHEKQSNVSLRQNLMIAHLHYSEMQVLETLKRVVFSHLRQYYSDWMSHAANRSTGTGGIASNDTIIYYTMSDQPCTFKKYLQPLLNLKYHL